MNFIKALKRKRRKPVNLINPSKPYSSKNISCIPSLIDEKFNKGSVISNCVEEKSTLKINSFKLV
jgi:hypothetical protein